ncbi:MAG TPA: rod shape-determining protein RodA [Chitinophagales bacterium]|nr:rod shape-determining protein RodA [Chitinophagales bacterium]
MAKSESLTGKIDWLTVFLYGILVIFGLMAIYSSVYTDEGKTIFDTSLNSGKQLEWVIGAVLLIFVILIVDSRFYVTFAYPIYVLIIVLTISVMFFGVVVKGQRNWIRIGGFQMQPSELAKFAVSLAVAKFVSGLNIDIRKWRDKWKALALIGIPAGIILIQGDAGQAIVFVAFSLVLFREGLESYFLIIGAVVVVLSVLALVFHPAVVGGVLTLVAAAALYLLRKRKLTWYIVGAYLLAIGYVLSVNYAFNKVLKPHQKDRINVLLGKEVENGKDWNVRQSIIAIGSGGFLGKGYLNGTQTKLKFVPEQSTDFIFSSIGEEFGFIGSTLLIMVYIALFFRLLFLAERQRSKFSRIYGYCVLSIFFFHFLVNVGMAIGVAPVIGIPLPFISYGGSSLLSFTLLLFVFIRLDTQRFESMR